MHISAILLLNASKGQANSSAVTVNARTHGEATKRSSAAVAAATAAATPEESRGNTHSRKTKRGGSALTGKRNGAHSPVHRKEGPVFVEGRIPERVPVEAQNKEQGVGLTGGWIRRTAPAVLVLGPQASTEGRDTSSSGSRPSTPKARGAIIFRFQIHRVRRSQSACQKWLRRLGFRRKKQRVFLPLPPAPARASVFVFDDTPKKSSQETSCPCK